MTTTPSINGWRVTATAPFRQWRHADGRRAQELLVSNRRRGWQARDQFAGIVIYNGSQRPVAHVGSALDLVRL